MYIQKVRSPVIAHNAFLCVFSLVFLLRPRLPQWFYTTAFETVVCLGLCKNICVYHILYSAQKTDVRMCNYRYSTHAHETEWWDGADRRAARTRIESHGSCDLMDRENADPNVPAALYRVIPIREVKELLLSYYNRCVW